MKNGNIILPALLLMNIHFCFAQLAPNVREEVVSAEKKLDRFYISLTGGPGIPAGKFRKYEPDARGSFFVPWAADQTITSNPRTGRTGRLSATYFFSKYIGATATLFAGIFKAESKPPFDPGNPAIVYDYGNANFNYEIESYQANGGMVGLITRIPCHKVGLGIRLLGGIQHAVSPETKISIAREYPDHSSSTEIHIQPGVSSTNPAWDAGIELKIRACHKMSLLFSADYITSKATFKGNLLSGFTFNYSIPSPDLPRGNEAIEYPFTHTKQISYISLNAGIAYTFK
jgi:hypothetical protein